MGHPEEAPPVVLAELPRKCRLPLQCSQGQELGCCSLSQSGVWCGHSKARVGRTRGPVSVRAVAGPGRAAPVQCLRAGLWDTHLLVGKAAPGAPALLPAPAVHLARGDELPGHGAHHGGAAAHAAHVVVLRQRAVQHLLLHGWLHGSARQPLDRWARPGPLRASGPGRAGTPLRHPLPPQCPRGSRRRPSCAGASKA